MTSNTRPGTRVLGTLRSDDGKGIVRMEDRFDTDIDDLWSAKRRRNALERARPALPGTRSQHRITELSIEGHTVVTGGIDLTSAELGGLAMEPGGEIRTPGQIALNLTNAEIRSDVTIGDSVHIRETIRLAGAHVRVG